MWTPLIKAADRTNGRLSFTNLVELHVLSTLRGQSVRVDRIRSATRFIHEQMGKDHPLADVDTHTDEVDVYVEYLGRLTNASTAQTELRPLVEHYLRRIDRDEKGLARRLFPLTRAGDAETPRLVVIDPARRFGRPVLAQANIETAIIHERWRAGESVAELASDFDVAVEAIEEAVRFETLLHAA